MTPDVTYLAALIAGLVSFLSPCVLPLVPPYLVYLAGSSLERLTDDDPRTGSQMQTVGAALLFVLGFSTVFVALGASASVFGSVVRAYSYELGIVAGVVIVVMGLHFLGITPIAWLTRHKRFEMVQPVGLWGALSVHQVLRQGLGVNPRARAQGLHQCGCIDRVAAGRTRRAGRTRCAAGVGGGA